MILSRRHRTPPSLPVLPPIVLIRIFCWADLATLAVVKRVCKKWRQIASDNRCWRIHLLKVAAARLRELGIPNHNEPFCTDLRLDWRTRFHIKRTMYIEEELLVEEFLDRSTCYDIVTGYKVMETFGCLRKHFEDNKLVFAGASRDGVLVGTMHREDVTVRGTFVDGGTVGPVLCYANHGCLFYRRDEETVYVFSDYIVIETENYKTIWHKDIYRGEMYRGKIVGTKNEKIRGFFMDFHLQTQILGRDIYLSANFDENDEMRDGTCLLEFDFACRISMHFHVVNGTVGDLIGWEIRN